MTNESTKITSTRGREVELSIDGYNVMACSSGVDFIADLTNSGFKTRFPLMMGGKSTHITVELDAENMAKAKVVFDELARRVKEKSDYDKACDAHYNAVIGKMNGR